MSDDEITIRLRSLDTDGMGVATCVPCYLDAKCKTGPVEFKIMHSWRHGIDRRSYHNYEKAGLAFRKDCAIGIVELFDDESDPVRWSGRLLIETLWNLGKPEPGIGKATNKMVYWPVKRFVNLDSLSPGELYAAAHKTPPRSYAHELNEVLGRKKQRGLW